MKTPDIILGFLGLLSFVLLYHIVFFEGFRPKTEEKSTKKTLPKPTQKEYLDAEVED